APRKVFLCRLSPRERSSFRGATDDTEAPSPMLGECFDPQGEWFVDEHLRPHWSQAGTVVFITFRTRDSIPREVIHPWDREKQEWMGRRGGDAGTHWSIAAQKLPEQDRAEFRKTFNRHREDFLDTCHGRCWLKRPELSRVVADSLLHFDGRRYR